MKQTISVKKEYDSLDKIVDFVKKESTFTCSKTYDHWDVRIGHNMQTPECVVIKDKGVHGAKVHFDGENTLRVTHVFPNKIMHAYFGNSSRPLLLRRIDEIIIGTIVGWVFHSAKKKSLNKFMQVIDKMKA